MKQKNYDLNGAMSVAMDPRGNSTFFTPDGFGRRIRVTDPIGHYTQYTLDEEDHTTVVARFDGFAGITSDQTGSQGPPGELY